LGDVGIDVKSNSGVVVRGCFVLTASATIPDHGQAAKGAYEVEQLQWSFIPAAGASKPCPDQFDASSRDLLCAGDSGSWVATWHFMLDYNGGGRSAGP
jgi:hypothetical protein